MSADEVDILAYARLLRHGDADVRPGPERSLHAQEITARLLVPGHTTSDAELTGFDGRWVAADGLVATAIVLSAR